MKILSIRPAPAGSGSTVAKFDAQLTPHIRMFEIRLVETPGGYRVYPPHTNRYNCATFAPSFAEEITRAALAALAGESDDRTSA